MARLPLFIQFAIEMAKVSPHPRYYIGAVAVSRGEVLGSGYNHFRDQEHKWSQFYPRNPRAYHAEAHALLGVPAEAFGAGVEVYVARITKSGKLKLARPCEWCRRLFAHLGVRRYIYTTGDPSYPVAVEELIPPPSLQ